MPTRFTRQTSSGQNRPYFYFNIADESHAKLLKQARKIDPMQAIGRVVAIDEY